MIQQLLPRPVVSLLLGAAWLLLNPSFSVGNGLLALCFGWALPLLSARWMPAPVRWRAPLTGLRLLGVVLHDMALSNVRVAWRLVGPAARIQSRFVWLALTLRSPHAITVLASIITLTPGTVSCQLSADRRHLLVHALDCATAADAAALVANIHRRYQQPLQEIFECA